jgi:hypothetical protein
MESSGVITAFVMIPQHAGGMALPPRPALVSVYFPPQTESIDRLSKREEAEGIVRIRPELISTVEMK